MKRIKIPKALKEQVWLKYNGRNYDAKCNVPWCQNMITVYDHESGHVIPHSKGGLTILENLRPICSRCNKSMSDNYTIDEWNKLGFSETNIRRFYSNCCTIF
jgi:5-methylcytosine-specific restriction endonuclease McrA